MSIANPTYQNYLAVYGTLRKGGKLGHVLEDNKCSFVRQIVVPGTLYNLGAFPGYKDSGTRGFAGGCNSGVLCDLFELPRDREEKIDLIRNLDQVENYLYNRTFQRQCYKKAGATDKTPYKDRYINYSFYIYTARDWVVDGAEQITGNPADWLEWTRNKDHE